MDALERLRALILPDERATLRRQQQALDALTARYERLPGALPELLARAGEGAGAKRLRAALAAPVADALGEAVRQRRQLLVDALFPVMGPAIRRAIAEYLRNFTDGLNRAVEYSLSPRGLAWRIEAWRSGVPFAQVVLRHTLRFRIDHCFLIDASSGIVLHRSDAADLRELDADAVAGMLTALGDFVRDTVAGGADSLDAATVGEHMVLVERGPRANLACFVRGVPTPGLRAAMARALERIHRQLDDPVGGLAAGAADAAALWDEVLDLSALDRAARAADPEADAPLAGTARWPARLLLLGACATALALGWWWWQLAGWRAQARAAIAELAQVPGVVVLAATMPRRGAMDVTLLVDPLAPDPEPWLRGRLPALTRLDLHARGYASTDPAIVLARARAAAGDWPAVRVDAAGDGRLALSGEVADALTVQHLRERLAALPGVTGVDTGGLRARVDPEVALAGAVAAANRALAGLAVRFAEEDRPHDAEADAATVAAMRAAISPALDAAAEARGRLRLVVLGHNDDSGSEVANRRVRELRARWLAARLDDLPGLDIAIAADDAAALHRNERSATVRIEPAP